MRVRILSVPVVLLAFTLSGCIVSSNGRSSQSGQYVSPKTFEQIEVGKSKDFVLAVLGPPTSRSSLEDGEEVWRWRYTETRDSSRQILFLLNTSNKDEVEHNTFVAFKDGVVTNSWRD